MAIDRSQIDMPLTAAVLRFDAVLFDMDGTLVDSKAGVEGAWETFAETYTNLDVQKILRLSHGVRTTENLRIHCGIEDPHKLESEAERFEQAIVDVSRRNGRRGIVCLPGVRNIIETVSNAESKPGRRIWAICTSATRKYATAALQISGIPIPAVFITAEDVTKGKPNPDPYILGAEKCGVDPYRCAFKIDDGVFMTTGFSYETASSGLVVEDTPVGVQSGQAAGCTTLGVVTTHTREQMEVCRPDYLVNDLSSVSMKVIDGQVEVTILE